MAVNFLKSLIPLARPCNLSKILPRFYSIYEPPYLEALKPKYPLYPLLNVQIRGYDYAILENFQSWVHKIAEAMDFDVEECYAFPHKEYKIIRYKPKSTVVEVEYTLKLYQRNIKMSNVTSVGLPIFIRICEAGLPEGTLFDIFEHTEEHENARYIPDKRLLDMQEELASVGKPPKKKRLVFKKK
ncbi:39S ribosomal protein L48, mitochondrial [Copidosoma floridanum]|uniref:39S ribosomal protein L48, mitochondrial n=1 Tax=Copidosoma floridanum TaxID=29053 RepID=UPI0006C999FE|nr:39S ribosomal protein L48, mitochondrial [Copidosoma floridanum]